MALLWCLALLLSLGTAIALRRTRPRWALASYRLALLATAIPYGLHLAWRATYGGRPLTAAFEQPGAFRDHLVVGAVSVTVLTCAAVVLARRHLVWTTLLPAASWLAYWYGALGPFHRREPEVAFDNVPNIWLFGASAVALVALLATALALLPPAYDKRRDMGDSIPPASGS